MTMAANTSQIFPAIPTVAQAALNAANTNRDGTGTLVTLQTGGSNGSRVDRILISAAGVTHANVLRFYVNTKRVLELVVPASNPAAGAAAYAHEILHTSGPTNVPDGAPVAFLGSGDELQVSSHVADAFHVTAFGGDY
jgi:hypothetical protein